MSTKPAVAPGVAATGSQLPKPGAAGVASHLSVPLLSLALTAAVGASGGPLPPPPLSGDELGPWVTDLGPTAAAFSIVRVVIAVVVLRLWATVAVVAVVRTLPMASRPVGRLGPLAEALGGRIARGWVRAALGIGVASTLVIPSPAAATETTTVDSDPPLLERIDDHGVEGRTDTTAPPPDRGRIDHRDPGAAPPLLVLVEPPSPEAPSPSPGSPGPFPPPSEPGRQRTAGAAGTAGSDAGPAEQAPPVAGSPREPLSEHPDGSGPRPPAGAGSRPATSPGQGPHVTPPRGSERSTDRTDALAALLPWTISPGEHLWHVAEATAAELAPGATTAEVAEYHHRLVAANAANLPVPGNPDLVYAGNVIVRPAWEAPA